MDMIMDPFFEAPTWGKVTLVEKSTNRNFLQMGIEVMLEGAEYYDWTKWIEKQVA